MADIDVVPRHKSRMWLWVILAIVAVIIVAMMLMNRSEPAASLERGAPGLLAQTTANRMESHGLLI
jgi:hypothetical protein